MTDAILPESTNSPAASLTSEPEKLLPVIQADRDAYLSLNMLPPEEAAAVRAGKWDKITGLQIFARHRLSSPVSGTDMVMVPREPTEAMIRTGQDAQDVAGVVYVEEIWAAMLSASPSTPIPVIAEAGERGRLKNAIWELLSHRGERPGRVLRGGQELWETWVPAFEAAMRYLPGAVPNAKELGQNPQKTAPNGGAEPIEEITPATLDNTAVEVETLRMAVKAVLPIGDDRKPDSDIIPIYVRMSELRALHTLTAKTEKAE